MQYIDKLEEYFARITTSKPEIFNYTYPYSTDEQVKREQIWQNLQHGLLLEDKGLFLPWALPYCYLNEYAESYGKSSGKIVWDLGSCTILDGYKIDIDISNGNIASWADPVKNIHFFFGTEEKGNAEFHILREWISKLFRRT